MPAALAGLLRASDRTGPRSKRIVAAARPGLRHVGWSSPPQPLEQARETQLCEMLLAAPSLFSPLNSHDFRVELELHIVLQRHQLPRRSAAGRRYFSKFSRIFGVSSSRCFEHRVGRCRIS